MIEKISVSALPSSFRYRAVIERGKPVHDKLDGFSIKHPPMELSRRAKIFSPFDALKGFSEVISSKEAEVMADSDAETEINDVNIDLIDDRS
ncbi:MAG: hypothetical protein K6G45_11540 [Lachnospiraceae bacterium]|nr:hypothetical protein [Lachnospiraceae bacterium]MCR5769105.1 hypothetical protein [Lachnospiraceae bacterium]